MHHFDDDLPQARKTYLVVTLMDGSTVLFDADTKMNIADGALLLSNASAIPQAVYAADIWQSAQKQER
jgi:hypothetical protein